MLFLTSASTSANGGGSSMILMLVLMFAIFYFLIIRPENKKKKKTDDTITFETGEDRVRIQAKKWSISTTAKMEAAEAEARAAKSKKK